MSDIASNSYNNLSDQEANDQLPPNVTQRGINAPQEEFIDIAQLQATLAALSRQVDILAARRQEPAQTIVTQPIQAKDPKAADVVAFDGKERRKLMYFIGQCEATFALQPSRFPSNRTKIIFVGQHMIERPGKWFQARYLQHLDIHAEKFSSYDWILIGSEYSVMANWRLISHYHGI